MDPPLSAALTMSKVDAALQPVDLSIHPRAIFSTSVGASHKKTLAIWHVTTPAEVVNSMLGLVNGTPVTTPAVEPEAVPENAALPTPPIEGAPAATSHL